MIFRASKEPWSGRVSLWIVGLSAPVQGFQTQTVVEPVALVAREWTDKLVPVDPSMQIEFEAAQSLIDALWAEGIRPSSREDPRGEVAALKDHLADMRRLAFKLFDPEPHGGTVSPIRPVS